MFARANPRFVVRFLVCSLPLTVGALEQTARASEPSPAAAIARMNQLDDAGEHAAVLQTLIDSFEAFPDSAWDRKSYRRAFQHAWGCFTKLPKAERARLIAQYTATSAGEGDVSIPPLRDLTSWLDELSPSTPLRSLGARLALAIWHHLEGNNGRFLAYGLSIPEQAPDSLAADFAIVYVVGVQWFKFDYERMLQTIRTVAKLAPDNRATGWAVCRPFLLFCSVNKVDDATALARDVKTCAAGKLAGNVAADMEQLLAEINAMQYAAAIARLRGLEPYLDPGPARHLAGVFSVGTFGSGPFNPPLMTRFQAIAQAGKDEAASNDPKRRALGLYIQASFTQRQGRARQAVELYRKVAAMNEPGFSESALTEIGRELAGYDPKGAIEALEAYRRRWGLGEGSERHLLRLARLYRKVGRYQDGLDLFQEVSRRAGNQYAAGDVDRDRLAAGMVGCLTGLGRNAEADALAEPLFQKLGYDGNVKTVPLKNATKLYLVLMDMGREQEAKALNAESRRRRASP